MPTYVYECKKCNHRFEILQSITDPPRKRCPECRGAVRRILMPGGGLIFRGSGFYVTDYRRKEDHGDRDAPAKSDGGTDKTKSDEKSATRDTPKSPEKAKSTKDESGES